MSTGIEGRGILAAGGVLRRQGPNGPLIAVVHRPKYDDWSLPKGKTEEGESLEQTALREVEEETACRAVLAGRAGTVSYEDAGRSKTVHYWLMDLVDESVFRPNREIDRLLWVTPQDAFILLHYATERTVVAGVFNLPR
jgi:8-oxo-dGTP diphosphatase